MTRPPRIVFDTNIALSALLFNHGRLAWLRHAWRERWCIPLISRPTAEELLRVLAYLKFKLEPPEREDLLADYLPFCETVAIARPPPAKPECRDPSDIPFLQLAVAGHADYLVTGDADLLALTGTFAIPIVTAEELREKLARRSG